MHTVHRGFIFSIQDQAIKTINYAKYVINNSNIQDDACRVCNTNNKPETIDHIIGNCTGLTSTEYTIQQCSKNHSPLTCSELFYCLKIFHTLNVIQKVL